MDRIIDQIVLLKESIKNLEDNQKRIIEIIGMDSSYLENKKAVRELQEKISKEKLSQVTCTEN